MRLAACNLRSGVPYICRGGKVRVQVLIMQAANLVPRVLSNWREDPGSKVGMLHAIFCDDAKKAVKIRDQTTFCIETATVDHYS